MRQTNWRTLNAANRDVTEKRATRDAAQDVVNGEKSKLRDTQSQLRALKPELDTLQSKIDDARAVLESGERILSDLAALPNSISGLQTQLEQQRESFNQQQQALDRLARNPYAESLGVSSFRKGEFADVKESLRRSEAKNSDHQNRYASIPRAILVDLSESLALIRKRLGLFSIDPT